MWCKAVSYSESTKDMSILAKPLGIMFVDLILSWIVGGDGECIP